jgi:hypothetical protein
MALTLTITEPADLRAINDIIHDCWFDTNVVELDRHASVLLVPFERGAWEKATMLGYSWLGKKHHVPTVVCYLRIEHVEEHVLEDTQGIGRYDFNVLEYEPREHRIYIKTNIPMRFEVTVKAFTVTVEQTDQMVDEESAY